MNSVKFLLALVNYGLDFRTVEHAFNSCFSATELSGQVPKGALGVTF